MEAAAGLKNFNGRNCYSSLHFVIRHVASAADSRRRAERRQLEASELNSDPLNLFSVLLFG